MSTKKSPVASTPKSKRGGARAGAGRKPRSPDDPPSAWRGGRPATRGDVTGRAVQARADSVEEANHWRAKAHASGMPFEIFFASVLRSALNKAPVNTWSENPPRSRNGVRGRIVQAVAASENEANHWRAIARTAGAPLEAFFAATLRKALGTA
jgi:hypothetical protein